MDTWTSALLWYFLWATRCAHREGKPCLAYAVDAGQLRPRNRRLVRRLGEHDRSDRHPVGGGRRASPRVGGHRADRVDGRQRVHVRARVEDRGWARGLWPDPQRPPLGIAAVDFSRWPVVIRPWGRSENRYRWPYFSRLASRRDASADLDRRYAATWRIA